MLWQYKKNVTHNIKYEMALMSICQTDLRQVMYMSQTMIYALPLRQLIRPTV